MPEQIIPEFSDEALEANIRYLAVEVARQKALPERREVAGQVIVKQSLRSLAMPPSSQQNQVAPAQDNTSRDPLAKYTEGASAETKLEVEYLVDVALHKGIEKANGEARTTTPYVLDAFHDALAGKLYPELKKRGLVD